MWKPLWFPAGCFAIERISFSLIINFCFNILVYSLKIIESCTGYFSDMGWPVRNLLLLMPDWLYYFGMKRTWRTPLGNVKIIKLFIIFFIRLNFSVAVSHFHALTFFSYHKFHILAAYGFCLWQGSEQASPVPTDSRCCFSVAKLFSHRIDYAFCEVKKHSVNSIPIMYEVHRM